MNGDAMHDGSSSSSLSGRGPFWRVVQLLAGVALFLYALRLLAPLPIDRGPFVLLAALLAAGSMALSDSVVGLVASLFGPSRKDPES